MKKWCALFFLAMAVTFGLASIRATAQEAAKETPTAPENRWDARVVRINTDNSTLDARKGHVTRSVHFDSNTKWTKTGADNKVVDISPSDVKVNDRVICLGKWNDKKEYWAERIDLRARKSAL